MPSILIVFSYSERQLLSVPTPSGHSEREKLSKSSAEANIYLSNPNRNAVNGETPHFPPSKLVGSKQYRPALF